MQRRHLSRRTFAIVSTLAALLIAGLAMSVVAFGQSTTTTPLSDYTSTTPTLNDYTSTTPTLPETTETTPADTQVTEPTTTSGTTAVPTATTSKTPERLAFTGYDPLLVGGIGIVLMLGAVALQRRRRATDQ